MRVNTFYDWYSMVVDRSGLLGPYISLEFTFLAELYTLESCLSSKTSGAEVLAHWHSARRALHPREPHYALCCISNDDPRVREEQMVPDLDDAFQFVLDKLRLILRETHEEIHRSPYVRASDSEMYQAFEFIRAFFATPHFFYHKAKAFEAFLLGLLSSYEYIAFGSYEHSHSGLMWAREVEKLPYSSTRTLADVYCTQEQVVEECLLYSDADTAKSCEQVCAALEAMTEGTVMLRDMASRRLLGFPTT